MIELSGSQEIWLRLFEQFLRRGIRDLHDLAALNTMSHALLRTIPAVEAQALLPTLSVTCAVCHVHGEPDGPRCAEHQLLDSTVMIFMGDEGTGVALCGDCRGRVEQLMVEAEALNPDNPEDTAVFDKPFRRVN
jgi:hypothetical protein